MEPGAIRTTYVRACGGCRVAVVLRLDWEYAAQRTPRTETWNTDELFTPYTVRCVPYTLYTVHYTPYNVHCTLYSVYCINTMYVWMSVNTYVGAHG